MPPAAKPSSSTPTADALAAAAEAGVAGECGETAAKESVAAPHAEAGDAANFGAAAAHADKSSVAHVSASETHGVTLPIVEHAQLEDAVPEVVLGSANMTPRWFLGRIPESHNKY